MTSLAPNFQDESHILEPTPNSDGFSFRLVQDYVCTLPVIQLCKMQFYWDSTNSHVYPNSSTGCLGGAHERRLLNDLMAQYQKLERPVMNESLAVTLKFGLTLQQIMDVVSQPRNTKQRKYSMKIYRMLKIKFLLQIFG